MEKIFEAHIFDRPNQKIIRINGLLENVALFGQLEHFSRSISLRLSFISYTRPLAKAEEPPS